MTNTISNPTDTDTLSIERPANSSGGWRWTTLEQLCVQDRKIVEPDSEEAKRLPYLSLEHIESVTGRVLRGTTVNPEEGRSTSFRFDTRHVLYGKLRPYLNKVALPDFEGRCTTELIPLLPKPGISRDFLAWLLRRPQTVEAAMQEKTGSRMPRADMGHVLSLCVCIPDSLEKQARATSDMAARFALVEQARRAIEEQSRLLDAYAQRALSDFPFLDEPRAALESEAR